MRRRLAENHLKPWRRKMWCIPQVDAEYVADERRVGSAYLFSRIYDTLVNRIRNTFRDGLDRWLVEEVLEFRNITDGDAVLILYRSPDRKTHVDDRVSVLIGITLRPSRARNRILDGLRSHDLRRVLRQVLHCGILSSLLKV